MRSINVCVFPCIPGTKIPITPHGFRDPPEVLEAALRDNPEANLAAVSGRASGGLTGIDLETEEIAYQVFPKLDELKRKTWVLRTPHGVFIVPP
jgi:hypothetical protein